MLGRFEIIAATAAITLGSAEAQAQRRAPRGSPPARTTLSAPPAASPPAAPEDFAPREGCGLADATQNGVCRAVRIRHRAAVALARQGTAASVAAAQAVCRSLQAEVGLLAHASAHEARSRGVAGETEGRFLLEGNPGEQSPDLQGAATFCAALLAGGCEGLPMEASAGTVHTALGTVSQGRALEESRRVGDRCTPRPPPPVRARAVQLTLGATAPVVGSIGERVHGPLGVVQLAVAFRRGDWILRPEVTFALDLAGEARVGSRVVAHDVFAVGAGMSLLTPLVDRAFSLQVGGALRGGGMFRSVREGAGPVNSPTAQAVAFATASLLVEGRYRFADSRWAVRAGAHAGARFLFPVDGEVLPGVELGGVVGIDCDF